MINAAGKQALKNSRPRVTICFAGGPVGALKSRFMPKYGAAAGKGRRPRGSQVEKQHFGQVRGGGNRTLTLSRHNRCIGGAIPFALRLGKGERRGRLIRGFGGVIVDEVP
jgi:hypothetical protein